ncbi:aldo/keto reductase, partial [Mesorhizobium sp.]
FDTADVYSFGASERLLGQSLRNLGVKRQDVIIATKVHGAMGDGPNQRGSSRGHIMDSVEGSLERLQLDHIDLYQLHGT